MSRSLNKVTLIGNLGNDPEIRATPGGGRVAQFSLATSRTWNDQAGVRQERTEWHRCVAWNTRGGAQLADLLERYVHKGDKLYLEGRVEHRQWTDKDGQTRYATEINVREVILLATRREGDGEDDAGESPRRAPALAGARGANAAGGRGAADDFEEFPGALDERAGGDLPF